jgi:hypothetical protein
VADPKHGKLAKQAWTDGLRGIFDCDQQVQRRSVLYRVRYGGCKLTWRVQQTAHWVTVRTFHAQKDGPTIGHTALLDPIGAEGVDSRASEITQQACTRARLRWIVQHAHAARLQLAEAVRRAHQIRRRQSIHVGKNVSCRSR